jgi:hypothetical protein
MAGVMLALFYAIVALMGAMAGFIVCKLMLDD